MKLLIELDEEYVKAIDKIKFLVGGRTDRSLQLEIIKAIKNGKALEQESTTKNDLGVDAVSRKAVMNQIFYSTDNSGDVVLGSELRERIARLPSVTPIRPKGHWIWVFDETPSTPNSPYEVNYAGWVCSCCHKFPDDICEWDDPDEPPTYKFCPNCGSDNREVEV